MQFLIPFRDHIYALTRIAAGLMFAMHGAAKLFGWFGGAPGEMPPALLYTAGGIELVGGLLICIGLRTSLAAFVCSGQMAVAYFMVHQSMGPLPIQNHGESAALYAFLFLLIASQGDGIWSVGGKTLPS
jgi:putative oxidoreductase